MRRARFFQTLLAVLATTLANGCAQEVAKVSATRVAAWAAYGVVHGEQVEASGEMACIPTPIGAEIQSVGYQAFPRWARIPLSQGRVLILDVNFACYETTLPINEGTSLTSGVILQDAQHPLWAEKLPYSEWQTNSGQWRISLSQTSSRVASSADRAKIIRTAQELLRIDAFCETCEPTPSDNGFVRIIRKALATETLPRGLFERWGDGSAGACRRSRPINIPGYLAQAGLEEGDLATCTRLQRGDPLSNWNPAPEEHRCDVHRPRLSVVPPHAEPADDIRIWRRSEFIDPLQVDQCTVVLDEALASLRSDPTAGDVRLYQSASSTFTLYAGDGVGIFRLFEGSADELMRRRLKASP